MNPLESLKKVLELLEPMLGEEGTVKWLDTPHVELRWRTPLEAIILGRQHHVVQIVEAEYSER